MAKTIADCFSRIYAINLPERQDRRDALLRHLRHLQVAPEQGRMEIFPAIRPDSAGGFVNRGVRGCFLSHSGVARRALDERLESVLVLEDDVLFSPLLQERVEVIHRELRDQKWGFVYLGHPLDVKPGVDGRILVPVTGDIMLAHCYGVHASVLPALVEFYESLLERPPGHPDGGPMHLDGAISFFRARHPEYLTLAAAPSLAGQRPSRSDLTPRWFDRVWGLREGVGFLRRLKSTRPS